MHLEHTTDLACCDSFLQLAHRGVEAFDVADGKQTPCACCGIDQRLSFLQGSRDRLLDQQMEAAVQGRKPHFQVKARGNRNHDGVHLLAVQHLAPRPVSRYAVFAGRPRGRVPILVTDGNKDDFLELAQKTQMVPSHGAQADEPDARHAVDTAVRTESMIRSRSASVRPGCTGSDSTLPAMSSETGSELVPYPSLT